MHWLFIGNVRIQFELIEAVKFLAPTQTLSHKARVEFNVGSDAFRFDRDTPEGEAVAWLFGSPEVLNAYIGARREWPAVPAVDLVDYHRYITTGKSEKFGPGEEFRAYMEMDDQGNNRAGDGEAA